MYDAHTSAASTTTAAAASSLDARANAGANTGAVGTEGLASAQDKASQGAPAKAGDKGSAKKAGKGDAKGDAKAQGKAGALVPNGTAGPIIEAAAPAGVLDNPAQAGARRPAGIEPDAEMDRIVAEAEKTWKREAEVQLVDLLDANSRGVLTLFPYTPRSFEAGKVYPVMTGHLDTRRVKVRVSAFAKRTEEGREFLSLAIGPQGQDHIGGAVFRSEEQDEGDGRWYLAPGKENERHGVISKTVRIEGTDAYETVFELRFYGRRRLTGAGVPYIKAQVYQERREAQANGNADAYAKAMEGCF